MSATRDFSAFGSAFPGYAAMMSTRSLAEPGMYSHEEFGRYAAAMIRNITLAYIPAILSDLLEGSNTPRQALASWSADTIPDGGSSLADVMLYHLYSLVTWSAVNTPTDAADTALTAGVKNRIKERAYFDARDLNYGTPELIDGYTDFQLRNFAELAKTVAAQVSDGSMLFENGVTHNKDLAQGFIVDPPGKFKGLELPDNVNGHSAFIMGIVHGRPFLFCNAPSNGKGDDVVFYDRDTFKVNHGYGVRESVSHPPDIKDPSRLMEDPKHKFYVAVPSHVKTEYLRSKGIPRERAKTASDFVNDIMAPKILNDFGRLLPASNHIDGIVLALNGKLGVGRFVAHHKGALIERMDKEAEEKREELASIASYYEADDVGIF